MLRPPSHRADAPIVYVHPSDPAWDNDRIARELKEYREADPPKPESQHPVRRYRDGHTRYDITQVQDYIGPDATKWAFKRIGAFDWQDIEGMRDAQLARGAKPRTAYLRALMISLVKCENGPTLVGECGRWLPEDVESIAALSFWDEDSNRTVDVLYDVGEAAYTASMPLSRAEKKA